MRSLAFVFFFCQKKETPKISIEASAEVLIYSFYFFQVGAQSRKSILVARFLKQQTPFFLPLGFSERFTIEFQNLKQENSFTNVNNNRSECSFQDTRFDLISGVGGNYQSSLIGFSELYPLLRWTVIVVLAMNKQPLSPNQI